METRERSAADGAATGPDARPSDGDARTSATGGGRRPWPATAAGHHLRPRRQPRRPSACDGPPTPDSTARDREAARGGAAGPRGHPGHRGRAPGAGPRSPTRWRTCFERDRDRILHATAFRRLAGKTQVFVFPDDHQRTRLTHALEVAQVATGVARACRLNVALTEAIALGHDCGHGPGGHASEDALSPYLDGGFDHAPWGADVSLAPLNLCAETLDGIRNHSWSRPAPGHPRGRGGQLGRPHRLRLPRLRGRGAERHRHPGRPARRWCGSAAATGAASSSAPSSTRWCRPSCATGRIGMADDQAEALAAFRASNYEHIYLRPSSVAQGRAVVGGAAGPGRALRRPAQPDPRRETDRRRPDRR